ncbi:MAG: hypothetical protein QG583_428 [Patescibacteria group bacterium]|nr:hypothetical protein [Patescibacteria group bacterium]
MEEKFGSKIKNFRNTRNTIENNKILVNEFKDHEDEYPIYDSSLDNIGNTFAHALPVELVGDLKKKTNVSIEDYGKVFKSYVEDTLSKGNNNNLSAIEFGGSGSKLFSGFTHNFFKKTLGVCLDDIRSEDVKENDKNNNHDVIKGDIFDKSIYLNLKKDGFEKFDLIISRIMAPLFVTARSPELMQKVIRQWYRMLNENGLIFAQFDVFDEHKPEVPFRDKAKVKPVDLRLIEFFVMDWKMALEKEVGNVVDIQLDRGIVRIHKKSGAPDELPILKDTVNFSLE